MKIEPIRKASIPKYAAALAAAAAAVMLTGCQTAGDVAIAGDIAVEEQSSWNAGKDGDELRLEGEATPDPSIENSEDDLRLDGKVVMATRPANDAGSLNIAGTANVDTDPGSCDDSSEVMLDGDVVFVPDFSESAESVAALSDDQIGIYADAFAKAGVRLERDPEPFAYYGYNFGETLLNQAGDLRVIFYSGIAADNGTTMEEWMQSICGDRRDWGETCTAGDTKLVFIDISRASENAPDHAAQIAKDVTA